ncbi:MAG: hypothetical protein Q9169_003375 [Polycauliona sp. 2 TL-2023]
MVVPAPEPESPHPTWIFDAPTPKLQSDISTQRPRAWERIPKSPFARRRKGKKVWKRYEASTKAAMSDMGACLSSNAENEDQDIEADGPTHNAKRLRSRDVSIGGEEQKPSKYVTTLRDQVVGTPRRKVVRRRSLRPDRLKSVTAPAAAVDDGGNDIMEREPSIPESLVHEDAVAGTAHLGALEEEDESDAEVEADPVQPVEGPLFEDIDEALSSPLSSEHVEEDRSSPRQSPESITPEIPIGIEPRDDPPKDEGPQEEEIAKPLVESTQPPMLVETSINQDTAASTGSSSPVEGDDHTSTCESPRIENDLTSNHQDTEELSTDIRISEAKHKRQDKYVAKEASRASASPQRSLRRSSRRSSLKNDRVSLLGSAASTGSSSSLVEIFEIETKPEQSASVASPLADQEGNESPSHDRSVRRESQILPDGREHRVGTLLVGQDLDDVESDMPSISGQENANTEDDSASYASTPAGGQPLIHNDDHLPPDDSRTGDHSHDIATVVQLSANVIDEENIMRSDVNNQVLILKPEWNSSRSPQMKTRSGARFSDDTSMLQDFLSRAKARKLVKEVTLVPVSDAATTAATTSPRRSQRNALATLDNNSPSPRKSRELAKDPGTPPDKPKVAEMHRDGNDEASTRGSPVRRSSRKRLPAPAKTATGAPSFIPVRRADGTDPVVLQKSIAQELALVTQTNTRRNKGQAKPPAVILKSLPVEVLEDGTKGGHALRNCKTVGWDQKLVYYQDGTEAIVDVEHKMGKKRPKAHRLRGLGAGNGTPAPKRKTADMLSSNGTSGTKRAGRIR